MRKRKVVTPELFFGGRDSGAKSDFLKRYGRYLRKLKFLQIAITGGIVQLCLAHLTNKGIFVKPEMINVVFKNELVKYTRLYIVIYIRKFLELLESLIFLKKTISSEAKLF